MTAGPTRIPVSTYRLQFNRGFTFRDAAAVVPYLARLGITDCYASSYLKATPGSSHGYDVADPRILNPEIGTESDYTVFVTALRAEGMGQILDVVPNHMGISRSSNTWWLDVLENGPSSRYAEFFDIDWHPVKPELENKILLPILGDLYGVVLENQEITLSYRDGAFVVTYYDYTLPIAPKSAVHVLSYRLDELIQDAGSGHPDVLELQSILTAMHHLPGREERDPSKLEERAREKEIIKKRLDRLTRDSPLVAAFLEENVRAFNGRKDDPRSFDLLDALLNDQPYRLAYWRVAAEEINYRRFFDINELAAIRVEDPVVFQETHQLIFRLLKEGALTGLRVDHVDGLYDPHQYLCQLQSWARTNLPLAHETDRPLYLIVEKILGKGESLPSGWPVYGTTGYEFLSLLNALFVDSAHEHAFDELYAKFIRQRLSYEELAYEKKELIMSASMASEVNTLGHFLNSFSERDRRSRDFTLNSLIHAIREIIACFPVYRTYVGPESEGVTDRDRAYIRLAVTKAKRRNPAVSGLVFDFIENILLNREEDRLRVDRNERLNFVMKFQQLTSPVTAKGVEDTVMYIYNRLVSLNEVGGEPSRFGIPVPTFHERMRERQAQWRVSLSATSTHDTKRSEDVRARINVLSEMPAAWRSHLALWSKLNKKFKTDLDGQPVPDRNEEYLLYQTLVGAWPFEPIEESTYRAFCGRIQRYMEKALHEAKVHSSWLNPNQQYDQAVHKFVEAILDRTRPNPFLESFRAFHEKIARLGAYNSLSQVLIKITAPGVPDFYQGTEVWDFSLVDPDNRRHVDYAHRVALLNELDRAMHESEDRRPLMRNLLARYTDGRVKLYVTTAALRYRRRHAGLFQDGDYTPLEGLGAKKQHVCAFARSQGPAMAITVAPRLVAGLLTEPSATPVDPQVWQDTWLALPEGASLESRFRHVLTGDVITAVPVETRPALSLSRVFADAPVALLEKVA
ncbi:malto-oligosyltrehalose synthase [Candidatus Nitrospira bockiana]